MLYKILHIIIQMTIMLVLKINKTYLNMGKNRKSATKNVASDKEVVILDLTDYTIDNEVPAEYQMFKKSTDKKPSWFKRFLKWLKK